MTILNWIPPMSCLSWISSVFSLFWYSMCCHDPWTFSRRATQRMMRVQRICVYLRKKPDAAIRFQIGYGNPCWTTASELGIFLWKSVCEISVWYACSALGILFEFVHLKAPICYMTTSLGVLRWVFCILLIRRLLNGSQSIRILWKLLRMVLNLLLLGLQPNRLLIFVALFACLVCLWTVLLGCLATVRVLWSLLWSRICLSWRGTMLWHHTTVSTKQLLWRFCISVIFLVIRILQMFLPSSCLGPHLGHWLSPFCFWKGETDKSVSVDDCQKFSSSIASITEGSDKTLATWLLVWLNWYWTQNAWIPYHCLFSDTILHSSYKTCFYTVSMCFEWWKSYN